MPTKTSKKSSSKSQTKQNKKITKSTRRLKPFNGNSKDYTANCRALARNKEWSRLKDYILKKSLHFREGNYLTTIQLCNFICYVADIEFHYYDLIKLIPMEDLERHIDYYLYHSDKEDEKMTNFLERLEMDIYGGTNIDDYYFLLRTCQKRFKTHNKEIIPFPLFPYNNDELTNFQNGLRAKKTSNNGRNKKQRLNNGNTLFPNEKDTTPQEIPTTEETPDNNKTPEPSSALFLSPEPPIISGYKNNNNIQSSQQRVSTKTRKNVQFNNNIYNMPKDDSILSFITSPPTMTNNNNNNNNNNQSNNKPSLLTRSKAFQLLENSGITVDKPTFINIINLGLKETKTKEQFIDYLEGVKIQIKYGDFNNSTIISNNDNINKYNYNNNPSNIYYDSKYAPHEHRMLKTWIEKIDLETLSKTIPDSGWESISEYLKKADDNIRKMSFTEIYWKKSFVKWLETTFIKDLKINIRIYYSYLLILLPDIPETKEEILNNDKYLTIFKNPLKIIIYRLAIGPATGLRI